MNEQLIQTRGQVPTFSETITEDTIKEAKRIAKILEGPIKISGSNLGRQILVFKNTNTKKLFLSIKNTNPA